VCAVCAQRAGEAG